MELKGLNTYEQALAFRAKRNEVVSSNIANADTPNYKARDFSFTDALSNAQTHTLNMKQTSDLHQKAWGTSMTDSRLMYRVPMQSSLDGNTVETDVEQAAFAENAVQYRASLRFLDGYIRSIKFALKGGD